MSKLFEIPIYAFSKETHRKEVEKYKQSLRLKYTSKSRFGTAKDMNKWLYLVCHPYQLWEFNHIVGFIVISFDRNNILFDLYLQAYGQHHKSKYYWRSNQKWLLENMRVGGWHFRVEKKHTSEEIRRSIHARLNGMIKELIPSKYYVDLEAFKTVDQMIDYRLLLKGE